MAGSGKTLFDMEEAANAARSSRCSCPMQPARHLAADRKCLKLVKALFSTAFPSRTAIKPAYPPRMSMSSWWRQKARALRSAAIPSGAGINSSFAVKQISRACQGRCMALGIAIGSGYVRPRSSKRFSAIDRRARRVDGRPGRVMEASMKCCETWPFSERSLQRNVEELTESLIRLVAKRHGLDVFELLRHGQRGALDWKPKFKAAVSPSSKSLQTGGHRQGCAASSRLARPELPGRAGQGIACLGNSEMCWLQGHRALRRNWPQKEFKRTKGVKGAERMSQIPTL